MDGIFSRLAHFFRKKKVLSIWIIALSGLLLFCVIIIILFSNTNTTNAIKENQPASTFGDVTNLAISVFISLVAVIALIYIALFLIRKWQYGNTGTKTNHLKIIERLYLSPKQVMYIIKAENQYLLVGVTEENMNLITELDLLDNLLEKRDETSDRSAPAQISNFSDLMKKNLQFESPENRHDNPG